MNKLILMKSKISKNYIILLISFQYYVLPIIMIKMKFKKSNKIFILQINKLKSNGLIVEKHFLNFLMSYSVYKIPL